jgi:hypothetical protein
MSRYARKPVFSGERHHEVSCIDGERSVSGRVRWCSARYVKAGKARPA